MFFIFHNPLSNITVPSVCFIFPLFLIHHTSGLLNSAVLQIASFSASATKRHIAKAGIMTPKQAKGNTLTSETLILIYNSEFPSSVTSSSAALRPVVLGFAHKVGIHDRGLKACWREHSHL